MNERFEKFKSNFKEKKAKAKEKVTRVKNAIGIWAKENPSEAASALGTAVIGGGTLIFGMVSKRSKKKAEFDERETRQWDPVTGQYFYTKRPMKNNEKLELSRRMKNGESKGEILRDMRLI